jgi:hypothetical protein
MLNHQVASERSSPEVMSRLRPRPEGSGSPFFSAKATFPEPNFSAADRAAAAGPVFASVHGSQHTKHSREMPGLPGAKSSSLGAADLRVSHTTSAGGMPGHAWDSGAAGGIASQQAVAASARALGDMPLNGSRGGELGLRNPRAEATAAGFPGRPGSAVSETSRSSMQSEPAKPTDYMSVLSMLERVRLCWARDHR